MHFLLKIMNHKIIFHNSHYVGFQRVRSVFANYAFEKCAFSCTNENNLIPLHQHLAIPDTLYENFKQTVKNFQMPRVN